MIRKTRITGIQEGLRTRAIFGDVELVGSGVAIVIADIAVKRIVAAAIENKRTILATDVISTNVLNDQTGRRVGITGIDTGQRLCGAAQIEAYPVTPDILGSEYGVRSKLVIVSHAQIRLVCGITTQKHTRSGQSLAINTGQHHRTVTNEELTAKGILVS